jgi:predicted amidohydrolase
MDNKKIRVAILQLQARAFSEQAENKEHILKFIEKAAHLNPDLIVLPECIYPCYFLSPRIIPNYNMLGNLCEHFLEKVKGCACRFQTFIALSLPEYIFEKKILYNTAVLIGDDGVEIGRTRKSFLWHFDNNWFEPGSHYPVFDTKIGKIGMFVCADGRQPEITRALSLQGAEILLDLTNLVTTGLERKNWTNAQADYIIPTRALENRVWIVMANKVGFEESSIQCCGKSAFFSPEGDTVLMASPDREEILFREIDLSLSHQKNISDKIDVFQNRRPELYSFLTLSTSKLPISKESKKEISKEIENPFAAVIQVGESPGTEFSAYQSKIEYFFHTLEEQEVSLLSFSQPSSTIPAQKNQEILGLLKKLTKGTAQLCSIVLEEEENGGKYKTIFLVQSGKIIGKYRKTHLEFQEKDNTIPGANGLEDGFPVFETRFGNIGMLLDYEGFFPEIARILTLKGADIIIWTCKFSHDEHLKICRTRSAENKVFIICPNSIGEEYNGHSVITSPAGQIIAGCLENEEIASAAIIPVRLARDKMIVPYTNAMLGRQPESYHLLTSE